MWTRNNILQIGIDRTGSVNIKSEAGGDLISQKLLYIHMCQVDAGLSQLFVS